MPRPCTNVFDIIFDFYESDETVMAVDVSLWNTTKQACDSLRRCIKNKRFKGIAVVSRSGAVFLMKT